MGRIRATFGRSRRRFLPILAGDRPADGAIDWIRRTCDTMPTCVVACEDVTLECSDPASNVPGRPEWRDRTMDDGQAKKPVRDARQERLKLALRANLKRRKAQARQRKDGETEDETGAAAPSSLHDAALAKDTSDRDE